MFNPKSQMYKYNLPDYRPAMEYLSGYSESIKSLSNEISALPSAVYCKSQTYPGLGLQHKRNVKGVPLRLVRFNVTNN